MKKPLYPAMLLLCLPIAVIAQQRGFAISDKVMIGHSWTVGNRSDAFKQAFHPTVQVGRSALFNVSDNVGIGIGSFFSTEGFTFKSDNNTEGGKAVQRMNYIRLPLNAIFTFGDQANRVRPRIGIGGLVGFLVGGKSYLLDEDEEAFVGFKTTKIMSTKVDAGASGLLGVTIRITNGLYVNHDISYYHGLVENKYEDDAASSFTHRNIGVSMGFTITPEAIKSWKSKMKHH